MQEIQFFTVIAQYQNQTTKIIITDEKEHPCENISKEYIIETITKEFSQEEDPRFDFVKILQIQDKNGNEIYNNLPNDSNLQHTKQKMISTITRIELYYIEGGYNKIYTKLYRDENNTEEIDCNENVDISGYYTNTNIFQSVEETTKLCTQSTEKVDKNICYECNPKKPKTYTQRITTQPKTNLKIELLKTIDTGMHNTKQHYNSKLDPFTTFIYTYIFLQESIGNVKIDNSLNYITKNDNILSIELLKEDISTASQYKEINKNNLLHCIINYIIHAKAYFLLDGQAKYEIPNHILFHSYPLLTNILLVAIETLGADKLLECNTFGITPLGIIKEKAEIEKDETFAKILLHLQQSKII